MMKVKPTPERIALCYFRVIYFFDDDEEEKKIEAMFVFFFVSHRN